MTRTRIVTINTGKGDGPYRERIALMARQLAALRPDIIACQESFACDELALDTARYLADTLEMCLFFTPARRKPREVEGAFVDSVSGMALLARGSWLTMDALPLPCDPADGERVAQVGTVAIRGRVVRVANLHLTHLRDADNLRARQLDTILRACDTESNAAATLLCGDFNTTAGGAVLGPLLEGDSPRLLDAWSASGGSYDRGTIVSRGPCGPCVDYILGMAGGGSDAPAFTSSRLVLAAPGPRGMLPSDHFGVMTELVHSTGGCS